MKRKLKSVLAVTLVIALLIPVTGLRKTTRSDNHGHKAVTCFSIDPVGERS